MIYFDNAATTFPKPESVYNEMMNCMKDYCANPGRSGHKMAIKCARKIYDTRENIAKLFNIDNPMNIVFTENATDSLNLAIKGALKSGDHVVTTSMEHNSVLRPLSKLKEIGVETTVVYADKEGFINPANIESAIKENTKLIISTHASNVCGTLVDIKAVGEIAKKHNVLFLADVSQTAGVYNIDMKDINVDMLAMPGHKGLLGPQGTGILCIREGLSLSTLKEGGTGSKSEDVVQPELIPDKYESGTHNTPGIIGLGEGVKFVMETGIDKIRKHEENLCQYMIDQLQTIEGITIYGPLDATKRAAVISINIDNVDSGEVTFVLDNEYDIATRSGIHCAPLAHKTLGTIEKGAVRFSMGYFNTIYEVDKVIKAIKNIASK
ncbi:MAG: aminotransferase class V-fold PLP-dependent enzyme [Clostridioides sp.]|jgi:cysteine desulfurase family protein|nr:aminotransferase class V-fold PLP-dependent enzyme [Clostridioides sp.]